MKNSVAVNLLSQMFLAQFSEEEHEALGMAIDALNALPTHREESQRTQGVGSVGWIPCSERLPEDDTLMLVNYIDSRPDAMDIWIGWHEMENVWYIDGEEHSRERGNEVIAWMPLPEPYREDGEADD